MLTTLFVKFAVFSLSTFFVLEFCFYCFFVLGV